MNAPAICTLPVKVINLDPATCNTGDLAEEALWERLGSASALIGKAVSIPVLLVNKDQMDCLCPPEKRKFLNPDRAKEILDAQRDKNHGEDLWEKLESACDDEMWNRYQRTAALGLYHRGPLSDAKSLVEKGNFDGEGSGPDSEDSTVLAGLRGLSGPFIALCCERISAHARSHSVAYGTALACVYYHELGHALMDTAAAGKDPYSELWARVLEESLANAISISCFSGTERAQTAQLTKEQPLEYRGWPYTVTTGKGRDLLDLLCKFDYIPKELFHDLRHYLLYEPEGAAFLMALAHNFGFPLLSVWRLFKRDQRLEARMLLKSIAQRLLDEVCSEPALFKRGRFCP